MKKLITITLLLALTSTAAATNAGKTIQLAIVYDGVGTPAPDEMLLMGSDWIELGIIVNGEADALELDLEIIGPGHVELPATPEDIFVEPWTIPGPVTPAPPGVSQIVAMDLFGTHTGLIAQLIMFHCDGTGDVLVQITDSGVNNVDGRDVPLEEMGSFVIYPEPCSLALLALGGLLLLRRRK
jgi:hypothetical protein